MRKVMVYFLLLVLVMAGCATHNQRQLNAEGIEAVTSTTNDSMLGPTGDMRTSTHTPSTQGLIDPEGAFFQMGGLATILKLPFYLPNEEGGKVDNMVAASPKDMKMESLKIIPQPPPGEPSLEIIGFEASISEPLKQYVIAIQAALTELSTMTRIEAEARVRYWEEAGKMLPEVLDVIKLFVAGM